MTFSTLVLRIISIQLNRKCIQYFVISRIASWIFSELSQFECIHNDWQLYIRKKKNPLTEPHLFYVQGYAMVRRGLLLDTVYGIACES